MFFFGQVDGLGFVDCADQAPYGIGHFRTHGLRGRYF